MVLMSLVVLSRSFLEPQSFSASMAPLGQCCVRASLYRGTTAEHALGPVGLSHTGSRLCVSDQGGTGGHVPFNAALRP